MDAVELLGGMKLTRKFIAALVVGVAIVALIQAFFDYRREREVFDRVTSGQPNKQIAGEIDAAERTVKAHRARVMEKMGVTWSV